MATGLGVPDSVKFDADGLIVSTQVASGQVLSIDPRTGEQRVMAQLTPGLDNCTFVDGRLFVSNFTGEITEIVGVGKTRTVLPGALNWPLDLAVGHDGRVYVADGTYFYALEPRRLAATPSACCSPPATPASCAGWRPRGPASSWSPRPAGRSDATGPRRDETDYLADGFDQLYGVAIAPGGIVAVEQGTGRLISVDASGGVDVLASGLDTPVGVTVTSAGDVLVSESGAGRVVRVTPSGTEPLVDGLGCPQGILAVGDAIFIVDAGAKAVVAFDSATGTRATIASGLPVGPPPGVVPKPLQGMPPFSGPQGPFAGIAAGPDGTLYVSADGDGSVLALQPIVMSTEVGAAAEHRYLQVARTLRKEIVDGVFPVGSQLPTEHDLCERFSVSRYTVREALRRLRDDNLISSRPRAGTMVVARAASNSYAQDVMSINDLLAFAAGAQFAIDYNAMVTVDDDLATHTGLHRGFGVARRPGQPAGRRRTPNRSATPSTTSTARSPRSDDCCSGTTGRSSR